MPITIKSSPLKYKAFGQDEYVEINTLKETYPAITTDTNNFLASTNDNTDRTADIQAMLNSTGVCHLGPGRFVAKGINLPNVSTLMGSGRSTLLILKADDTQTTEEISYVVKLGSYTSVENMRIYGQTAPIKIEQLYTTVDATTKNPTGQRFGIIFEGEYADDHSVSTGKDTFYRSRISGCIIQNFTGAGITCNGTGLAPSSHLLISDCEVCNCGIGLNIPYFSEFNRISNCSFQENYYGCINNGGNNSFSCCDFSSNICNLLMDDSANQSRNNSHGTFSACQFAHPYSEAAAINQGTCMRLLGLDHSELFVGCRFGNGTTEIRDCVGIRFSTCRFSFANTTLANNKVITFTDCMFREGYLTTPMTLIDNNNLHFTECYCFPTSSTADPQPYDPLHEKNEIPTLPTTAGNYVLKCVVTNDTPVLAWTQENT